MSWIFPIWVIAVKDLKILKSDKMALFWVVGFPLIMALFFGAVFAGGGSSNGGLSVIVVDEDKSPLAERFVKKIASSAAVKIKSIKTPTWQAAQDAVRGGRAFAALKIPLGFSKSQLFFSTEADPKLTVVVDPSRTAEKGFLQGILTEATVQTLQTQLTNSKVMRPRVESMLKSVDSWNTTKSRKDNFRNFFSEYSNLLKETETEQKSDSGQSATPGPQINIPLEIRDVKREASVGPTSPYEISFPSAILWAMLGTVASFSISIVRERKNGTLLRLRVAPLSLRQIIGGKALACFICCVLVTLFLTIVGVLFFKVKIQSHLAFLAATLSMSFCFVGITILVSCLGRTEEAVSNAGWGIMIPCAMVGGGMVPLFFMPAWLRQLSVVSPVKWGILGLEGAIWRQFQFAEMALPCGILIVIGVVTFFAGAVGLRRLEA